ncbi:MAG TPA: chemotaxis protein CheA [Mycobacteriales bacterium]|nr:chemotaxis protein CheA [Mycobacteriales bacterium]
MSGADELDEIVSEFLVESHENLDQLDRDLVALEQEPDSRALLGSVFRTIHTIKGTSGFLGMPRLERLTHTGENLLSLLRDGELRLDPDITSALLQLVDTVRAVLADIETSGSEGDSDHDDLIGLLASLAVPSTGTAPEEPAEPADVSEVVPTSSAEPEAVEVAEACAEPAPVEPAEEASNTEPAPEPSSDPTGVFGEAEAGLIDRRRSVADSSIRVDVGLLDSMMQMVGELVLTRNQIVQHSTYQEDLGLVRASQRLDLIVSELQGAVMRTRMQPIDNVFSKLPRVVRDLAQSCGKQVRARLEGRDTELDKTVLEAIKDPLTHLTRNAVDHGIETPEERAAAGKPEEAVLLLRAFHESGQVVIEISDDGRGIDTQKVARTARERGVVSADRLAAMSERDLLSLIFLPGLSTAAAVTNVSGRGVGMDVVKTNIERIGGTVEVSTRLGVGTTIRVRIPLTLAIIPALLVSGRQGDRYAIPQANLVELVRLEPGASPSPIELVNGAPVHRLRGRLLPLVSLEEILGSGEAPDWTGFAGSTLSGDTALNVVVLQADGHHFGLVVDEVHDTQEIVVKPLDRLIKTLGLYAGATIMGDGRVALILDAVGIAQAASVIGERREQSRADDEAAATVTSDDNMMLVFTAADGRRLAVPLAHVARLEEVDPARLERTGDRHVLQYRDQLLPVLRVGDLVAGVRDGEDGEGELPVVVFADGDRRVGLAVHEIVDVVTDHVVPSSTSTRGLIGCGVIAGKVTDLLDVDQVLRHALTDLAPTDEEAAA